MNKIGKSEQESTKRARYLSPIWAYPLALFVWWVLPWAISLLTPHYGWQESHPGIWNLLGLPLILTGTAGLIWGVAMHSAQSSKGVEWELDKSYLLTGGLYAYSRHPMYFTELILLLGWVVFYGSVALLVVFLCVCLLFNFYQVPLEERILEAHFGEAYRDYKSKVPRWFGKRGR